jgi:hypothetical protein
MASLHETQLAFKEALLGPGKVDLTDIILEDDIRVEDRIGIYGNNIFGRWTDTLRSAYPVVDRLIGKEFFDLTARGYFKSFPSAAELKYLPDVAKLEWACHCVFFAKDHSTLNRKRLAEVSPSHYLDLKFKLHPATELIRSHFPIDKIWIVNQEGYEGEQTVDLDSGGVRLIVKRESYISYPHVLSEGEFLFLQSLESGQSIETAWENSQKFGDTSFNLINKMQDFISQSILVEFYF